jgi:hypothetical protein
MDPMQLAQRYGYPSEYNRYDTQFQGAKEAIGWTWYDRHLYTSAATTVLTFFTIVPALLDAGNMEVAGQLASPKAFFLRAIRVHPLAHPFSTTAAADANIQTGVVDDLCSLLELGVLQLTIGQKIYGQWPLWMLPSGGGIVPFMQTGDIDVVIQMANNGICDPRAVYSLTKPLFIAPQINFRVDLLWPAGPITLDFGNMFIWVGLDGDLIRPVQ